MPTTPAHTVIRAIYEAVEKMGFRTGNILEPSMGDGGQISSGCCRRVWRAADCTAWSWIPSAAGSQSSFTPRLTSPWAGFETTDRRDFYDLAIGNVPFGQYQVNDKAYNKLGFNILNYFFRQGIGPGTPRRRGGFCHQPLYDGRQGFHRAPVSGPAGRTAGSHSSAQ